jgi:hypothetical protein
MSKKFLNGATDKDGKQLSKEDYTTDEKTKLASVPNFVIYVEGDTIGTHPNGTIIFVREA